MIAHFSSKLNKQLHAAVVAFLLAFCMLGTHWVGLSHGISHMSFSKQTVCESPTVVNASSSAHNSDVCHLFDALTLAGCIPPSLSSAPLTNHIQSIIHQGKGVQVGTPSLIGYQSQAPIHSSSKDTAQTRSFILVLIV